MHIRVYDPILDRLKGLHPKLIDLTLERVERLLAALDHPERRIPPVVHVAGTNGKGSTLAYLRAMAEAAGMRVHVYTSPHLVRFNERIRVAGQLIGDAELAEVLEICEGANAGQPITFFEVTTAAAFLAFARHPADLCLLETGMGGIGDATNILARPALTLLSSISFDHEAFLGDTLASIAANKAGIIKPGVPCLSVAQPSEAMAVIGDYAQARGAPLLFEGRDWRVASTPAGMRVETDGRALDLPRPALPGSHQIGNAGLAVMAALTLNKHRALPRRLYDDAIAAGLLRVEWPARLQRLRRGPLVDGLPAGWELWLDGGHNPGGGAVLARMAEEWSADGRPLDIVVGMRDTKDAGGFLRPFAGRVRAMRTVGIPGEAHVIEPDRLAAIARAAGLDAHPAASVAAALADLAQQPDPARLLVCGSLYLAGIVLAENG